VERRATKRFRVKLPIIIRWMNQSGIGEAQTESENISSRGVYFFLPREINNGSSVEFVIIVPHEITLAGPVRVRCQGRVRRTEIGEMDRVGVVAEIERYEFLRGLSVVKEA
jgi:PilZ domain